MNVGAMSPLLRPLRKGFTSMTFGSFQEWKTVIVLLLPLVSMQVDGCWLEETLASYLLVRQLARKKLHTRRSLMKLDAAIFKTKKLMLLNFSKFSKSEMNFPKFHDLDHLSYSIKEFGAMHNASAQGEEHAHIQNSKTTYARSNKKEAEKQMAEVT
jgi:hypothetical protein